MPHVAQFIVQSKSEGPEGSTNVVFRPKPVTDGKVSYVGQFSANLPPAVARDFEPGTIITQTLEVAAPEVAVDA